jgi:hypothetical protein
MSLEPAPVNSDPVTVAREICEVFEVLFPDERNAPTAANDSSGMLT